MCELGVSATSSGVPSDSLGYMSPERTDGKGAKVPLKADSPVEEHDLLSTADARAV